MKILLIHIRPDPVVRDHEFDCYVKQAGLQPNEITRINVFERLPHIGDLSGHDALIVGGSGDVSISDGNEPEKVESIIKLLQAARTKGMPIFGACFGGQLMVNAFGGRIVQDKANEEVGTVVVTKTSAAANCPVFGSMPEKFDVQIGHKDHIAELPPGAIHLASSEKSKYQAFTFPGEPVYGTIFHPELDEAALKYRIDYYAELYGWSEEFRQELFKTIRPTPDAVKILRLFIDMVVKNKEKYCLPVVV